MSLFDKKPNWQKKDFDNYTSFYADLMKVGFILFVIGCICYGMYNLFNYLFN